MTSARTHPPTSPRTRSALPGALVLAALLFLTPGHAAAEPGAGDLTGTWRHIGGKSEQRKLRAAIDDSVAEMTVLARGLARKRLVKGSRIPQQLRIEASEHLIAVRHDGRERLSSPPGHVTRTVSATGDEIELLHELRADSLVQYRTTRDGGRRTTYRVDSKRQRLMVEVVTSSHYLPSAVTYQLTYERVADVANTPRD